MQKNILKQWDKKIQKERFTKNKYAKLKDITLSKGIKIQQIENEDENRYIFFMLDKNNIISSITII